MVEIVKTMVTSFKRFYAGTATFSALNPAASHHDARLCWRLLHPTGKSETVSCGITATFSWILVHKVLFVPSKSLFPQSCVSSGSSMVGLMVASSKRAYVVPKPAALIAPVPAADHY